MTTLNAVLTVNPAERSCAKGIPSVGRNTGCIGSRLSTHFLKVQEVVRIIRVIRKEFPPTVSTGNSVVVLRNFDGSQITIVIKIDLVDEGIRLNHSIPSTYTLSNHTFSFIRYSFSKKMPHQESAPYFFTFLSRSAFTKTPRAKNGSHSHNVFLRNLSKN